MLPEEREMDTHQSNSANKLGKPNLLFWKNQIAHTDSDKDKAKKIGIKMGHQLVITVLRVLNARPR